MMYHLVLSLQCMEYCYHGPYTPHTLMCSLLSISLNEVFGDIMVLASPPRPSVDPDDVNTLNLKNIQPISFKFYMWVSRYPLRYFAIEI